MGRTNPHARRLRRDSTNAERLIWRALRNRQLGGFKFRRQATIGWYIPDFVCIDAKLVIELDGGQHDAEMERERTKYLEQRGFNVLRFWNNDILENLEGVLETILAAAENKGEPSPCPLPHAGEG
ncbi:MAG: endonuclease domain-containing protein [Sphingomonas sp.]|nr:endonuclease domain-containing protein [Sphingomonas sp.]